MELCREPLSPQFKDTYTHSPGLRVGTPGNLRHMRDVQRKVDAAGIVHDFLIVIYIMRLFLAKCY